VISTPTLSDILRGLEMRPSVNAGERGFNQAQVNDIVAGNSPAPSATQPRLVPQRRTVNFADDGKAEFTFEPAHTELGFTPVHELMNIQKEIDQKISSLAGDTTGERVRLIKANNALKSYLTEHSPDYNAANETFGRLVQPRTNANVAEDLYGTIKNPDGSENLKGFLSKLEDPESLLKSAGAVGNKQFLEQQMLPGQIDTISKIKASALRKLQTDRLPSTQGIAPEMVSTATELEKKVPPVFSTYVTALRRGMKFTGAETEKKVNDMIESKAVDPQQLADLMDNLPLTARRELARILRSGTTNEVAIPYLTSQTSKSFTGGR